MEMASTKEHIGGIIASLERWARSKTMDEALDALRRVRVPCAPVLGVDELIHDQHLQAREMTVEVGHPVKGESAKVMVPGVPVKLSQSPGKIEATSPLLGQHNEEIYCHRLGYAREELAKLGEEEVI
jgi:crotonobetainyl-CoA:carnitine CoA-transferase CaiB-like acyl-CoA transferase